MSITDPIIALEALVETAPAVGITLLGDGAVIVERSWDGGATWHRVRGGALVLAGGDYLVDYAAPLCVETTYRVVQDGVTLATAQITVPSTTAWLQDPLDPSGAVPVSCGRTDGVRMLTDALTSHTHEQAVDVVTVDGAAMPVAALATRRTASALSLHLRGDQRARPDMVDAMRRLAADAGQLLLRGHPTSLGLPAVMHLAAPTITHEPAIGGILGWLVDWTLDATLVRPVSLTITIPRWTYEEVAAMYPEMTYAEVTASRPGADYLSWRRDPRP